jgi:uridine monophosphate synthetase
MTVPFFTRLEKRARESNSLLCIGLDPHPELLGENSATAAYSFCCKIIEATSDFACSFKPNSAFFEALGPDGMEVLSRVIRAIPERIPVILDAKRGDIASTARAYAKAVFDVLGADAVTVSPYLGWDSLEPMLSDPKHGVFMLCKTSNPSADEIQAQKVVGGEPLYVQLARRAASWKRPDHLGLVVGATDPQALAAVRMVASDLWILAPGVGAQGGDLEKAIQAGLRSDGYGLVIPVSRGIATAHDPRHEANRLRDEINEVRSKWTEERWDGLTPFLAAVADGLFEAGCVKFGSFTMKSGIVSPIYIDLRLLASHPALLSQVAGAYMPVIQDLKFDCLAAIPYAALPIGTAISLQVNVPMIYHRKEVKEYGTQSSIEGVFDKGDTALVIDDLITTGGSKIEAIERLKTAGLNVTDIAVLIDRRMPGLDILADAGYHLHSVFTLEDLLHYWVSTELISKERSEEVREFLIRGE